MRSYGIIGIDMEYYEELARRLRRRYLDSLGNVVLQKPADVYSDCNHAATAITDLLARAEAAEARAEKAERERDAAVDLIGWIYYEACVSVEYDVRQHLDWLKDKIEQWRKKKGE